MTGNGTYACVIYRCSCIHPLRLRTHIADAGGFARTSRRSFGGGVVMVADLTSGILRGVVGSLLTREDVSTSIVSIDKSIGAGLGAVVGIVERSRGCAGVCRD